MTAGKTSANLDLTIDNNSGTFASSDIDNSASFGVVTDNYTGYTLTLAGSDDTRQLTNTNTSTSIDSIDPTLTSGITTEQFDTTTYNNTWAYLPSTYYDTTSNTAINHNTTKFFPAPTTTNNTTLDITTAPNPTASNDYTIGLGARVDYTKSTGTYTNTFILTATANPASYIITYDDNTGDTTVAGLPSDQSSTTSESSITLASDQPVRDGYNFKAWCDKQTTNSGITCSGNTYDPGDTYYIDQTADNITTLYALWEAKTYSLTITFAGTGVDSVKVCATSGDCTRDDLKGTISTSGGSVSGLSYNNAYYLYPSFTSAELESWENTGTYGILSCTKTDTCATDTNPSFTMGLGNGAVSVTGKANSNNIQDFTDTVCQSKASSTSVELTDARDGNTYNVRYINGNCWMVQNLRYVGDTGSESGTMIIKSETTNINMDKTIGYTDLTAGDSYEEARIHDSGNTTNGVWYNYAAASAMTITADMYSNPIIATTEYDLCPKGWRLPTKDEYVSLKSYVSDFAAVPGGEYGKGSIFGASDGYLWASTRGSSTGIMIRAQYIASARVLEGDNYQQRGYGQSMRCILGAESRSIMDVTTMQEITSPMISNTADGATVTLTDSRDNQEYTVVKYGNLLWMTRNLAIGCNGSGSTYGSTMSTKSLTKDNTSISSSFSTPTNSLTKGNSYDDPYMACDATYGAWYNYAAVSAKTITGWYDSDEDYYSICPLGWRLPAYSELVTSTDFQDIFNPVTGGFYVNGGIQMADGRGGWWSSTAAISSGRERLNYDGSALNALGNPDIIRTYGYYVRCVRS